VGPRELRGLSVALPEPAERMRAYVELARVLAEEGEAPPADAGDRVLRSLRTGGENGEREGPMAAWTVERRRLALLHGLRPIAAAGCAMAAVFPFAGASWRWGWGFGDAVTAFLTPGWPLAGVVCWPWSRQASWAAWWPASAH
jgi:hypothetical protein